MAKETPGEIIRLMIFFTILILVMGGMVCCTIVQINRDTKVSLCAEENNYFDKYRDCTRQVGNAFICSEYEPKEVV